MKRRKTAKAKSPLMRKKEIADVVTWARSMLTLPPEDVIIWDCETTDFTGFMVQLAGVNGAGDVLGSMLINPEVPIEAKAMAVHGITEDKVKNAVRFKDAYEGIYEKFNGKHWIIYNSEFDTGRLHAECKRLGLPAPKPKSNNCAMIQYAIFNGDWNAYHGNYKWQKLAVACSKLKIKIEHLKAHDALSDVYMTLEVVKALAKQKIT